MIPISLPIGVRFNPTDEELLLHYLRKKVLGENIEFQVIRELQIYDYAPDRLPELAYLNTGDPEWYFFCHLNRKHPNGRRTSRATPTGFWKTTGDDRTIFDGTNCVGKKKTLVFYDGKTKGGSKTDWFIYEYRLEDPCWSYTAICQDKFVVCKLFKKSRPGPIISALGGCQPSHTDIVELEPSETSNVDPPTQQPKLPENSILPNMQFSPPFDFGDDYLNLPLSPLFDYGISNEYITTEDCISDIHRACPPNAWEEMIDYPDSQSSFCSIESQYPAPLQQHNSLPSGPSDFKLEKMLMTLSERSAYYPGTYADTNTWFPDGVKKRKLYGSALQKFQIDQLEFPDGNTQQQLHHFKHMP